MKTKSHLPILAIIILMGLLPGENPTEAESTLSVNGTTYFVSSNGSDTNPGTEDLPWASIYHAAQTLQAGDTAIFEDGLYIETRMVRFTNDGTASEPIILKARNKHQAKIEFRGLSAQNIYIIKKYITIQDFELTQDVKGTTTSDQIIRIYTGGDNAKIIGNIIHNAYEEGVKTYNVSNILVEGNIIYDFTHEGIDFTPAHDSIVRNNEIYEIGRTLIMIKAESRNVQVYNNFIHNNIEMTGGGYGILFGGDAVQEDPSGYTAYNLEAWNNVVVSETPGRILHALTIYAGSDCAFFNNIVIGAQYGFYTREQHWTDGQGASGIQKAKNPTFINNIILDSTESATLFTGIESGLVNDYNLYFNSPNLPTEEHGIYADPLFVDLMNSDFHLQKGSLAIDAGNNSYCTTTDIAGNSRPLDGDGDGQAICDIGVYEVPEPELIFADVPFDHWAYDYIITLYENGYIAGCATDPKRIFCPESTMKRSESSVFVVRGLHPGVSGYLPPIPTTPYFDDILIGDQEEWFSKWVGELFEQGFTSGCNTNPPLFCPLDNHTRAEATVFYLRMRNGADFVPADPSSQTFNDVTLDMWYAPWVQAAYEANLIQPCQTDMENMLFRPEENLTRAEAACMMFQALPEISVIP